MQFASSNVARGVLFVSARMVKSPMGETRGVRVQSSFCSTGTHKDPLTTEMLSTRQYQALLDTAQRMQQENNAARMELDAPKAVLKYLGVN